MLRQRIVRSVRRGGWGCQGADRQRGTQAVVVTGEERALLREEFLRLLTVDSQTQDRRRRDYNQAIFAPEEAGGWAVFNGTDLHMVMRAFDRAVKNLEG